MRLQDCQGVFEDAGKPGARGLTLLPSGYRLPPMPDPTDAAQTRLEPPSPTPGHEVEKPKAKKPGIVRTRPYHALKAIPGIDRKLLDGIAAGRSLLSLATQYAVDDMSVLQRLQQYPQYRTNLRIGLELRMDKREGELEVAETNVGVTRADRLLGHARWLAERQVPDRFGLTRPVGETAPIQINIHLDRAEAGVVIDAVQLPQRNNPDKPK